MTPTPPSNINDSGQHPQASPGTKALSSLGAGCRRAYEALQRNGPVTTQQLAKLMPEGCQSVRSVRGRVSELCALGFIVVDHRTGDRRGRMVNVYRAVPAGDPERLDGVASQALPENAKAAVAEQPCQEVQGRLAPNFLAYLDVEMQFIHARNFHSVRRVNFERVNEAWLVRFLPVGLGAGNLWFVRNGQHWLNQASIVCPQCVSPDFGGDPNAPCPVCELAQALKAQNDDGVRTFGFNLRARITYLTYCLVYEIDPGRGDTQLMSESEILKPWEFQLDTTGFVDLAHYFRRGVTPKRPYSILDLENGNDFWATMTTKGVRLDRQEPAPILDSAGEAHEAKIAQMFSAITQPKMKVPTLKELEAFAQEAEAASHAKG